MGVKIDISGAKISGNARVLNNMDVKGKNDVDINIKKSKIDENAKVLNDIYTQNGKLKVDLDGLELGENVDFMNGRHFRGNNRTNQDTFRQNVQQNYSSGFQTQQRQNVQLERTRHKKGFIQKIKDFLNRFKQTEGETNFIPEPSTDLHRQFEDEISRNGTLRGINNEPYIEKENSNERTERQIENENII